MDTLLQQYLNELKSSVHSMAGQVEEALMIATKALAKKEVADLGKVFELEEHINNSHIKIDRDCFKLLARQSPVATDLRLIIVSTKMSVDLERMGDLCCSISKSIESYLSKQPVVVANEVPRMADLVRTMVRKGLDAFLQNDEAQAAEVLAMDDSVDEYRDSLIGSIKEMAPLNVGNLDAHLELFTIVRNLERIGDHATNIAEEVIFLITGEDIRNENNKKPTFKNGGSDE